MNEHDMVSTQEGSKNMRQLPRLISFLILTLILASCRMETAEAPGMPAAELLPTSSAPATIDQDALSSVTPTVEVQYNAAPVAEPIATGDAETITTATAPPTATADAEITTEPTPSSSPEPTGALIQVSMAGQVGVLLDEIPLDNRDLIVDQILESPAEFWLDLAQEQLRLTRNRLNFRNFIYPGKGQLPLPPDDVWQISLDATGPRRSTIQGHDLLMVDYTFNSMLLTDSESPAQAEPALAEAGGVWQEPFVFPADPRLLLQRTGNACINEGGFPPNSFDSENVHIFYDYTCEADSGGAAGCHRTRLPRLSCLEALEERVGQIEAALRFERLAWDSALADEARVAPIASESAPDLAVVGEDLETNHIVYDFIEPENCALGEGAVGDSGWRRLLKFSATVHNVGGEPLDIGPVVAEDPVHHVFEYNACHDHFHYSNYGDFALDAVDQAQTSKQAFCVQSTSRYSNNEATPLNHNYSCRTQGIQAGWVDEYVAGLDTQWIDITDLDIPPDGFVAELTFTSNSDRFLCEGTAVLDESGEQVWEPSGFTTADGESINRPQCDFIPDWDTNNRAARDVFIPQSGSVVTESCAHGAFSPLRNCGFTELFADELACEPGAEVERTFRLEDSADLQVVRVCERSAVLGTGIACTYEQSLANVIVGDDSTQVNFICPQIRDSENTEGGYALYSAPIWPQDAGQAVVPIKD